MKHNNNKRVPTQQKMQNIVAPAAPTIVFLSTREKMVNVVATSGWNLGFRAQRHVTISHQSEQNTNPTAKSGKVSSKMVQKTDLRDERAPRRVFTVERAETFPQREIRQTDSSQEKKGEGVDDFVSAFKGAKKVESNCTEQKGTEASLQNNNNNEFQKGVSDWEKTYQHDISGVSCV